MADETPRAQLPEVVAGATAVGLVLTIRPREASAVIAGIPYPVALPRGTERSGEVEPGVAGVDRVVRPLVPEVRPLVAEQQPGLSPRGNVGLVYRWRREA
jgi:hypothetical protein